MAAHRDQAHLGSLTLPVGFGYSDADLRVLTSAWKGLSFPTTESKQCCKGMLHASGVPPEASGQLLEP